MSILQIPALHSPPSRTPVPPRESPASTNLLIAHILEDLLDSQPSLQPPSPVIEDMPLHHLPEVDPGQQVLLAIFSELLEWGLAHMAAQITADIKADIQGLGTRVEVVEESCKPLLHVPINICKAFRICKISFILRSLKLMIWRTNPGAIIFVLESGKDTESVVRSFLLLPDLPDH